MTGRDEMTCEEFKEMAPAYALAVVDEAERTACTRHLAQSRPHRGCVETMGEARQVTEHLFAEALARPPSPRVWRAIEARITDLPTRAVERRRRLREFGGWAVAAVVMGFYLFNSPAGTGHRAQALNGGGSTVREALGLMTTAGTRLVAFRARGAGLGRATLIVHSGQRRALVLADELSLKPAQRLRLWGARGASDPTPICPIAIGADGIAAADLGAYLFEANPPDRLVLATDGTYASAGGDILLTADIR